MTLTAIVPRRASLPALAPALSPQRCGGASPRRPANRRSRSTDSFSIERLTRPGPGAEIEALREIEVDVYGPRGEEQHVRLSFDALAQRVDARA